jgi:hypothetical protein
MSPRAISLPIVICVLTLFSMQSFAQNVAAPTSATPQKEQSAGPPPNRNSLEGVAYEIELLRKSLQAANTRLREISDRLSAPDSRSTSAAPDKPNRIALSMELLARAEERAGILRKQLVETIEKEMSYKSRLAQIEEDIRPENVERALSGIGTTRTAEMREVRRRSLDIEKRGLEGLLVLATQNRGRLDDDVRQADALVSRLRQRLLPLIDKEVEKISPN